MGPIKIKGEKNGHRTDTVHLRNLDIFVAKERAGRVKRMNIDFHGPNKPAVLTIVSDIEGLEGVTKYHLYDLSFEGIALYPDEGDGFKNDWRHQKPLEVAREIARRLGIKAEREAA